MATSERASEPYITPQPRRTQLIWRARMHRKFRGAIELLTPFIPEDAVCLDIGANHGRFAIELSRMRPRRRVIAFEPLGANLDILSQATRPLRDALRFGRSDPADRHPIEVVGCGLSSEEAEIEIVVPTNKRGPELGSAFLAPESDNDPRLRGTTPLIRETIHTRRLDDVLAEMNIARVGFIKMDVEGHERPALEGGRETLERDAPGIIVEIAPRDADDKSALSFLATLGYRFYDLDMCDRGRWLDNPSKIEGVIRQAPKAHDVLCWRPTDAQPDAPAFGASFSRTQFGA